MDALDRKNMRRGIGFAVMAVVCGGLLAPYLLWILVDTADHLLARMTYLAAVLAFLGGTFSLDAFVLVLRFGCMRRSEAGRIVKAAHALLRAALGLLHAAVLLAALFAAYDAKGAAAECFCAVMIAAALIGGYAAVYRLYAKLKAEQN